MKRRLHRTGHFAEMRPNKTVPYSKNGMQLEKMPINDEYYPGWQLNVSDLFAWISLQPIHLVW